MLIFAETTMRALCVCLCARRADVELVEFNGQADHVDVLVIYRPTLAISHSDARGPRRA
ncbi:transposase [Mycobacterium kansasii]|nr:transposase [Mycobacterium kansasii]UCA22865.1 transposase [Mycobacterium kansasii]